MKYIISTLGCKVNQYETQAMETLLQSHGHEAAKAGERADAVIAAYEYTPMSVRAALDAIAENEFPGTLPVTLQPIQP